MVNKYLSTKNQAGFSLMELLVTVSIIGVLSTAGVPVYRRMVSKAKTSEAKVNLGAIANVESMFQSEYNTYGNNLNVMGFSMDGAPTGALYAIGFFDTACASAGLFPAGAAAASITPNLPNWTVAAQHQAVFGRAAGSSIRAADGTAVANTTGPKTACPTVAGMATSATAFVAGAAGGIRNGVDPDAAANNDIWTIDNTRSLVHLTDGT